MPAILASPRTGGNHRLPRRIEAARLAEIAVDLPPSFVTFRVPVRELVDENILAS
jgi:hypothetical protein